MNLAPAAFDFLPAQPGMANHFDDYIELRDHISQEGFPVLFYQFVVPPEHPGRCPLIPGGCIDILFPFGAQVSGPMVIGGVRSRTLSLQPGTTYFGARLLPVPLAPHSLIPIKKLANSCVPLGEFLPARLCSMLRLPLEGGSFFSRISLFQEGITRVTALVPLRGDREPKGLGPAIDRICEARGNISLSHLSGMLNCSSRHFRSLFEAYVGIPPKTFCQIVRFQSAVRQLLQPGKIAFSNIVSESGYYDQAHFIREFKKFSRECPTVWLTHLLQKNHI
ncbi:MAG TPA: helix-turn-helix domain-containing protein [Paenibacillus cookii]|nr:helix-turn-helix domain-containing protein [Paenibacillus cookii]